MSIENKNRNERGSMSLSPLGEKVVAGVAIVAAMAGTYGIAKSQQPEFRGEQTVVVGPGDTVDGLINEHVEGGASHTGEVRSEVLNDPGNADVFKNGQLDPGEELELPKKVTN